MGGSVGIGGGKDKGKESTASPAAMKLADLAEQFATETGPLRQTFITQLFEALSGRGADLPVISQAVERARRAGSQSLTSTKERLAQTDLAGTPFGEMIQAQSVLEGNIGAAGTESQMVQAFIDQISNFVLSQAQTASGGLAGAIPGMTETRSSGKETGAVLKGEK
jgi:hypothetical protein